MSIFDALGRIPKIVEANVNSALSPERKLDQQRVREYEQQLLARTKEAEEKEAKLSAEEELNQLRETLKNE